MSKLNTFAAVLKFINGANNTPDALRAICVYTTDTAKTNGGTLIATQGCSSEHPVEDMLSNKRLHNKTHGKQYEHFVLAPCPNGSDKSPEDVLKAVKEIVATVFPENIAVITVHTDTKIVHAHTVLDAVNAVTGRKFSQSPADLNRVKQKANSILKKNGFELITASANEFVDHTDHSKEVGLDFLELNESQFITEATIEEISSLTGFISLLYDEKPFDSRNYPGFNDNFYGGYNMYNNYTSNHSQAQEMPLTTPSYDTTPSVIPVGTIEQQKQNNPMVVEGVNNNYPNLTLVTGPIFKIKGTPESNLTGLNELGREMSVCTHEEQLNAANISLAINQHCQQSGYIANVSVYAGPIFDIDLTGGMYSPTPDYDENKF